MREKITFEPGQEVQAKLDRTESKPVASRNGGTEYMRVCDDDERIMFAPEGLELAITESGATAGDVISIRQMGRGKTTRWDVAIVGDVPAAAPQPAPRSQRGPQPAARLAMSNTQQLAEREDIQPPQRSISSDAAELASAYAAAIEATAAAESYAAAAGVRDIRFSDKETITRLAMTVFIARSKQGGRN
jgi:hypothetical protein